MADYLHEISIVGSHRIRARMTEHTVATFPSDAEGEAAFAAFLRGVDADGGTVLCCKLGEYLVGGARQLKGWRQ